mmetsp:Transcript_20913/g.60339  ORF Transcript_20913/g.60339 Transcript_20913/m.60339 type:complete len:145 (+) Transcript_20913:53-487(+)
MLPAIQRAAPAVADGGAACRRWPRVLAAVVAMAVVAIVFAAEARASSPRAVAEPDADHQAPRQLRRRKPWRFGASLSVRCSCRVRLGHLQCGGLYYSLMQCGMHCPSECHRLGLGYQGCNGAREIGWFDRLHYSWTGCGASDRR